MHNDGKRPAMQAGAVFYKAQDRGHNPNSAAHPARGVLPAYNHMVRTCVLHNVVLLTLVVVYQSLSYTVVVAEARV